jgi:hypothetical protein
MIKATRPKKGNRIHLSVDKMKMAAHPDPIIFQITPTGDSVTLSLTEYWGETGPRREAILGLVSSKALPGKEWQEAAEAIGVKKATFYRDRKALLTGEFAEETASNTFIATDRGIEEFSLNE